MHNLNLGNLINGFALQLMLFLIYKDHITNLCVKSCADLANMKENCVSWRRTFPCIPKILNVSASMSGVTSSRAAYLSSCTATHKCGCRCLVCPRKVIRHCTWRRTHWMPHRTDLG